MRRRDSRRPVLNVSVAALVAVILAGAYQARLLTTYQQIAHDLFYRTGRSAVFGDVPGRFGFVAIDDATLDRLGRWAGWDRGHYARVVDALTAAGARTIVFNLGFFEPAPGDDELARAIREARTVVLPMTGRPDDRERQQRHPADRRARGRRRWRCLPR